MTGTTLCNRWRVLRELGRGGMSTVYEAEDADGTRVAIKVLHPVLARNPRTRERFFREGRLAVGHPDAVRVLESREAPDGRLLLVMELLEGQTLRKRCEIAGGKLEAGEVLLVGDRVLQVLAAAHAKGIFHRDIKPENVFLTSMGGVKVLDFGIAAFRDEALQDASITQSGAALGTPAFMAPEQARGLQAQVDARTDLWALGATLFYCLTGRHVHEEALTANEAVIFSATQRAPRLGKFRPDLARDVGIVVDRALAFAPGERWPNADAMREAVIVAGQRLAGLYPVALDLPSAETENTLEELIAEPVSPIAWRRLAWLVGAVATTAITFKVASHGRTTPEAGTESSMQPQQASARELEAPLTSETATPDTAISGLPSNETLGARVQVSPPSNHAAKVEGPRRLETRSRPSPVERNEPAALSKGSLPPSPGLELVPDAVLNRRK